MSFSDSRPGPPGKVGAYHRTLSTYVNALTDAVLQLVRQSEPRGASDLADHLPPHAHWQMRKR